LARRARWPRRLTKRRGSAGIHWICAIGRSLLPPRTSPNASGRCWAVTRAEHWRRVESRGQTFV